MKFEERIKEIQEEFDRKIKELKEEFDDKVFPEVGDEYLAIDSEGAVFNSFWNNDIIDRYRLEIGNVFETEEEAEFEAEKLKILTKMKKYSKPFEIRGNNFIIKYVHQDQSIKIGGLGETQYPGFYFESAEMARKVIEEIGEDNIKRYYLGIK